MIYKKVQQRKKRKNTQMKKEHKRDLV